METISVDELAKRIKQLMLGSRHHIRNTETMEEAQQTYLHLEEVDEYFHR